MSVLSCRKDLAPPLLEGGPLSPPPPSTLSGRGEGFAGFPVFLAIGLQQTFWKRLSTGKACTRSSWYGYLLPRKDMSSTSRTYDAYCVQEPVANYSFGCVRVAWPTRGERPVDFCCWGAGPKGHTSLVPRPSPLSGYSPSFNLQPLPKVDKTSVSQASPGCRQGRFGMFVRHNNMPQY